MKLRFGRYVRAKREELYRANLEYSVRKMAKRIGFQPAYLSKVEREEVPPPSEKRICQISEELREDPDVLLALAGRVSTRLQEAIIKRPQLFAELIGQLKDAPDHAILRMVPRELTVSWGRREFRRRTR